jgi:hypothetical protein
LELKSHELFAWTTILLNSNSPDPTLPSS